MRMFPRITPTIFALIFVVASGAFAVPRAKSEAEKHFDNAVKLQASGKLDQAAQEYRACLKLAPKLVPALNNLGSIYIRKKHYAAAESNYREILNIDPKNTNAMESMLRLLMSQREPKEALVYARKLMDMKPGEKRYKQMYGAINVALKDYTTAAEAFRSIIHTDPNDQQAYSDLAGCYIAQENYQAALGTAEAVIKLNPNSPQARMTAAYAAEKIGDNKLAIKHYEAATSGPAAVPALINLARLYKVTNEPDKSVNALKRTLKVDKNNFDALFNLGAYEYGKQHWKQAESYWTAAKRVRPDEFSVNLNLAMAQARQATPENYKEALQGTTAAINAKPKDLLALEAHAYVLENLGQPDKAIQVYERWKTYYPKDAVPNMKLGQLYLARQNKAKPWTELEAALKKSPSSAEVNTAYADALAIDGQCGKANTYYKKAMDLKKDDVQIMVKAAACLQREKKPADAIKLLEQVLTIDSDSREARGSLGLIYSEQGKTDLAIAQFKKLLQQDPKDGMSMMQLAQLYDAKKEYAFEADTYRSLIKLAGTQDTSYLRSVLAGVLEKSEDYAGALKLYAELASSKDLSTKIGALRHSGEILEKQGKPAEAIDMYKRVIALQPDDSDTLAALGKLYEAQKKSDEFHAFLKSIIDTGTANLPLKYYALEMRNAGKADEAIKTLEATAARLPDNIEASLELANEYMLSGQKDKAIGCYKSVTDRYPEDPTANKELGMIYLKNGQQQEAVAHLAIAARHLTGDRDLLRTLGDLYYGMPDKRTEALNAYRDYLKVDPANQEIQTRVGEMEAGVTKASAPESK